MPRPSEKLQINFRFSLWSLSVGDGNMHLPSPPHRWSDKRSTTMKPSTSIFGQAATALLAGALLLGTAITAKAHSEQSPNGLEGTWRVQVTQYNCATGATLPPFWSLLSFARGGVLTETTTSPGFLPGQRTPGHGVWISAGANAYTAVSEAFVLFDSPTTPP